jgi:hypothetical protein
LVHGERGHDCSESEQCDAGGKDPCSRYSSSSLDLRARNVRVETLQRNLFCGWWLLLACRLLDDDERDVVSTSVVVRHCDQTVRGAFDIYFRAQHLLDEGLLNLVDESVRAEEHPAVLGELELPEVDLYLGFDPDGSRHDVAAGVMSGIRWGYQPVVNQFLHQGVVLRQLVQP